MWLNLKLKWCSWEYRNRCSHITETIEPLKIFLLQQQKRCQNSQLGSIATWMCGGTANPQLFLLPVQVKPTLPDSSGSIWGKFGWRARGPVPGKQEGQQCHSLRLCFQLLVSLLILLMLHSLQQEHPAWTVVCTQHPKPPVNTAGKTTKPVREKAAWCTQLSISRRSHREDSHEQARAEPGELPEEDRQTWANTVEF